jgi:hypothetical protein
MGVSPFLSNSMCSLGFGDKTPPELIKPNVLMCIHFLDSYLIQVTGQVFQACINRDGNDSEWRISNQSS